MTWIAHFLILTFLVRVGFLGAGLIFKGQKKDEDTGEDTHVVHGLTTAASVWLSASIGIGCGGALYFVSSFSVAIILVLLRFGPRFDVHDKEENVYQDDKYSATQLSTGAIPNPETIPFASKRDPIRTSERGGQRKRPQLQD